MLKPIKRTTPRVNPGVREGPCVTVTCLCRFIGYTEALPGCGMSMAEVAVYGVLTMYQALCYFALWRLIFKKIRHCLDFNGDTGQMAQVLPPKSNDRTTR